MRTNSCCSESSSQAIRLIRLLIEGGPSGCALASRLAKSSKHPQVLLLEAGGSNADPAHEISGERYATVFAAAGYNWGYKTVPQSNLNGRQVDYSRGKGLSGSTSINFCVFVRGSREDYNEIARRVGDDIWRWENTLERFKKVRALRLLLAAWVEH